MMLFCQNSTFSKFNHLVTDGWAGGWTDTSSNNDAKTHLKMNGECEIASKMDGVNVGRTKKWRSCNGGWQNALTPSHRHVSIDFTIIDFTLKP